jgi:hypothetical protein
MMSLVIGRAKAKQEDRVGGSSPSLPTISFNQLPARQSPSK